MIRGRLHSSARLMTDEVPPWTYQPATQKLANCRPNEAYAAATKDGQKLVLYFPQSDSERAVSWKSDDSSPSGK